MAKMLLKKLKYVYNSTSCFLTENHIIDNVKDDDPPGIFQRCH